MTVAEVAGKAAVSEKTIRRAIRRGELVASKVGSRLRVSPTAYEEWIARGRVVAEITRRNTVVPAPPEEAGSLARLQAMEDAA